MRKKDRTPAPTGTQTATKEHKGKSAINSYMNTGGKTTRQNTVKKLTPREGGGCDRDPRQLANAADPPPDSYVLRRTSELGGRSAALSNVISPSRCYLFYFAFCRGVSPTVFI